MNVTHQVCKKCGISKPLEDFSPKKTGRNGRRTECKECRRVPHLREKREAQRKCIERYELGEEVKFCPRCETCKPMTAFSNSSSHSDGKRSECKDCRSKYYYDNHERAVERIRAYYDENQETIKAYRRAYYQENLDHEKQRNRVYYRRNQKRIRLMAKDYRKRKPEVKRASAQRRLARKRGLLDNFTAEDWQRALDYFGHRCAVCGREADDVVILAADHWIPLVSPDCPGTVPENILPLCHGVGGCNNEKQDRPPREWLRRKLGEVQASQRIIEFQTYFQFVQFSKVINSK